MPESPHLPVPAWLVDEVPAALGQINWDEGKERKGVFLNVRELNCVLSRKCNPGDVGLNMCAPPLCQPFRGGMGADQ